MKPRLLDLFCGAGGSAVGYARAGFDVVGVDINPQPAYPFTLVPADAIEILDDALNGSPGWIDMFDVIHASPPCQAYSTLGRFSPHVDYPDLYEPTRERLQALGAPWVIENVVGAPYRSGFVLCGSMFGLRVRRHRNFESSELMFPPRCDHPAQGHPTGVYGHGQFFWRDGEKAWRNVPIEEARAAMGIGWMDRRELAEAIPPAYTEFIGAQLLASLENVA